MIAERPKIGPHVDGDAGHLAGPLGVDAGAIASRARPTKASTPPAAARRWRCTPSRSSRERAHDRLRRARRVRGAPRRTGHPSLAGGAPGRAAPNRRTGRPRRRGEAGRRPVDTISEEQASRLSSGRPHQGVIAEVQAPEEWTPADLVAAAHAPALLVVLDGIEDPHNLGAILRTADAAGVDGVIRQARRAAPLDGAVGKTSAGAVAHLKIATVVNVTRASRRSRRPESGPSAWPRTAPPPTIRSISPSPPPSSSAPRAPGSGASSGRPAITSPPSRWPAGYRA